MADANREAIRATGFEVLTKRSIVARPSPGSAASPLARDFERYDTTIATFVRLAMIRIMLPRLARTASS